MPSVWAPGHDRIGNTEPRILSFYLGSVHAYLVAVDLTADPNPSIDRLPCYVVMNVHIVRTPESITCNERLRILYRFLK